MFFEPIGDNRYGSKALMGEKKTTTKSVKGKEVVKNRKAKKGEVKKTKSKINGTQTTTSRTAIVTGKEYAGPRGIYAPKYTNVDGGRPVKSGFHPYKKFQRETTTTTTPAKRTTVKTKIKKRGRR